jgi:hypothetical protein
MLECSLISVGLIGPGLENWDAAAAVLRGEADWQNGPLPKAVPGILPANERRRATPVTRLVLASAQQAIEAADIDPISLPTVFASCSGDLEIAQKICLALAMPERPVSPMVFHNSVHNATAGYYSIGSGSRAPSTSITAGWASAAAGLLEAAVTAQAEQCPVLLLCYDAAPSQPLAEAAGIGADLYLALLISPDASAGRTLQLSAEPDALPEPADYPTQLAELAGSSPSADLLPLLAAVANAQTAHFDLPLQASGRLRVALG